MFDGTNWTDPISIPSVTLINFKTLSVDADISGNLHMVFFCTETFSGGEAAVFYTKWDGTSWSSAHNFHLFRQGLWACSAFPNSNICGSAEADRFQKIE